MEGELEIYWNGNNDLDNDFEAFLANIINDMNKVEVED